MYKYTFKIKLSITTVAEVHQKDNKQNGYKTFK